MELLVVLAIVGILAAIAGPSLWGMMQRARINQALSMLRGGYFEVNREAQKKSRSCWITFPSSRTFEPTLRSDCFVTGNRTLTGVAIRHNYSGNRMGFDFQGRNNKLGTVVIYVPGSPYQKCLVTSNLLGATRAGTYRGNETQTSADLCDPD